MSSGIDMKNKTEADSLHSLAEQFHKLADIVDNAASAYEQDDKDGIESAMKDFVWEFLKMQHIEMCCNKNGVINKCVLH